MEWRGGGQTKCFMGSAKVANIEDIVICCYLALKVPFYDCFNTCAFVVRGKVKRES